MKMDKEDLHLIEGKKITKNKDGYYIVAESKVPIHRLVMKARYGQIVDHINGDRTDDRKCNLRFVTPSQNSANREKRKDSNSIYKGVYMEKRKYKDKEYTYYTAKVKKDGKVQFKKTFKNEVEAARYYDEKAREVHGSYARLNFPNE